MSAEEFEASLLEVLSNPVSDPKYPLWAQTNEGQIVGFHYESAAYCYDSEEHSGFPGWRYHLLSKHKDGSLKMLEECHERFIQLLPTSN